MGDGPLPCRLFFLGEGPGETEWKRRRVFCGKTGREFDGQYLPLAGLDRPDVRVSNVTKCPRPGFVNPTKEEAASCADRHLLAELEECNPRLVVAMGAAAASVFTPEIVLEMHHGIPQRCQYKSWEGWVFPMYHPSAGLHESTFMNPLQQDFQMLSRVKYSTNPMEYVPIDKHKNPRYLHVTSKETLWRSLLPIRDYTPLAIDTETTGWKWTLRPWCMTYSCAPGTGYLIRWDQPDLLIELDRVLSHYNPLVLFHNALFDLPILQSLGIRVQRFDDTMGEAYRSMYLPQSLKVAAYRLLGIHMQEFDDLVRPYSLLVAIEYLSTLRGILNEPDPPKPKLPRRKKGEPKIYRIKSSPTYLDKARNKVNRMIGDWPRLPDLDPWKRWNNWDKEQREILSDLMGGPLPSLSITHVPFPEALVYACRDADVTFRLHSMFRKFTRNVTRGIGGIQ